MLLAVVLHIVSKFYGGEYDPLYIERVKQTLFLMYDKTLIDTMEQNNKVPPMHIRVPNNVPPK